MANPENAQPEHQKKPEQKRPLETLDRVKWDNIKSTFDAEAAQLEARGVRVGFIIADDADPDSKVHSHNADEKFFPASTGKLFLAEAMVTAQWDAGKELTYPARMVDLDGGGVLDKAGVMDRARNKQYTIEAGKAIHHMLNDSSNTPIRLIAEEFSDGGEYLRGVYRDLGYETTTLDPHPNGRFYMGDTTPQEVTQSLHRLISFPNEGLDTDLARTTAEALWTNTVMNQGTRQGVRGFQHASKSGEYNGDEDTPAVRNDVFVVTDGDRQLSGAFFASGRVEAMGAAEAALKRLGKELTHAFGNVNDRLGSAGLHDTVHPPEK